MILTHDEIERVMTEVMRTWEIDPGHKPYVMRIDKDRWSLNYTPENFRYDLERTLTAWTANIIGDTFYALDGRIATHHRGKGHGAKLYELQEEIARRLGCKKISQYPSGTTATGDTRYNYCLRRGWVPDGDGGSVCKYLEPASV